MELHTAGGYIQHYPPAQAFFRCTIHEERYTVKLSFESCYEVSMYQVVWNTNLRITIQNNLTGVKKVKSWEIPGSWKVMENFFSVCRWGKGAHKWFNLLLSIQLTRGFGSKCTVDMKGIEIFFSKRGMVLGKWLS